MQSLSPWSLSLPTLVGLNTALTTLAICLGADLGGFDRSSPGGHLDAPPYAACARAETVATILEGNLLVGGVLLAGAVTLGGFTVLTLFVNGFMLGSGGSLLWQEMPHTAHLLWRYVPLEFAAFAIVAGAAQHLARSVYRCLAFDEPPPFRTSLLGLAAGATLLFAAAVLEADVHCLLRRGAGE